MYSTCLLKLRILDNVCAIERGAVFWVHDYFLLDDVCVLNITMGSVERKPTLNINEVNICC